MTLGQAMKVRDQVGWRGTKWDERKGSKREKERGCGDREGDQGGGGVKWDEEKQGVMGSKWKERNQGGWKGDREQGGTICINFAHFNVQHILNYTCN